MIIKAALLIFRDSPDGPQLLFVRPHGKDYYVLPGGKQEPNETIEQALERELREELSVSASDIRAVGVVSGETPDNRALEMHLYTGQIHGDPQPHAEIAEICWFSRMEIEAVTDKMTPMTLRHIMPFLTDQRLW